MRFSRTGKSNNGRIRRKADSGRESLEAKRRGIDGAVVVYKKRSE